MFGGSGFGADSPQPFRRTKDNRAANVDFAYFIWRQDRLSFRLFQDSFLLLSAEARNSGHSIVSILKVGIGEGAV